MVKIKSWLKLIKLFDVDWVHIKQARQQHHNRCTYSHHEQRLLFLSILINF